MKAQRSYSDPEIARYVLGLDMADQAQDIQTLLAHDDAAAARALKWEAYLLGIVDALPHAAAPDTLLPRIQQTLGMTFEAPEAATVLGETRERTRTARRQHPTISWAAWLKRVPIPQMLRHPSRKAAITGAAVGAVLVILIAIVTWASVRTTPTSVVHEVVSTQNTAPLPKH
ncbi:MAG TPA: hypothetical protein VF285_14205 [Castellaniella sp.]|uniref:hypothetical protein n=1 Tax=Castellaniella sp. TaxID=1955812 RepID=UPI002EE5AFB6